MTAFEKMKAGEWTDVSTPEIVGPNDRAATLMRAFNATGTDEPERWRAALAALLPNAHPTAVVKPPFVCDFGTEIFLGENCWIGGGSVIRPGVTIGNRVVVAAGSVVVDDVPDDVLVAGNPARVKRKL